MVKLSRPASALPTSCFWTWDHSTNWVLDDPGVWNRGCANAYLKRPETFLEDYRQVTDLAAGLGVKGIVIYGFLRDSHGGIEYAKRVADYAASKGVRLMPGVGLTWYGGPYFEGEHKYNVKTFLRKNPHAQAKWAMNGNEQPLPGNVGVCPTHPDYRQWITEGLHWLFKEFNIGGVNMENGDLMVCQCERCQEHKKSYDPRESDLFRMQALAYLPAINALKDHLKDKWIQWATYTWWTLDCPFQYPDYRNCLPKSQPRLCHDASADSIAQWSIKGIVRKNPLPLAAYLDDGCPEAAFDVHWPKGHRPANPRSTGLLYQGSQWWHDVSDRYRMVLSTIKEACLRSFHSGLEGIALSGGEVTDRHIPWLLNYLAFSHFIHWPQDTLRDFGKKTLGQVLDGPAEGEKYVELLTCWDNQTLTDSQKKEITAKASSLRGQVSGFGHLELMQRVQLWDWLERMARGQYENNNVGWY